MNLETMLEIQSGMDAKAEKHRTHVKDSLWLITELGELANEWGGFKYRHQSKGTARERLLYEYVDVLSILLSLGLYNRFFPLHNGSAESGFLYKSRDVNRQFLKLFGEAVQLYKKEMDAAGFTCFFRRFLALGEMLGLAVHEIEAAYFKKQERNQARMIAKQREGLRC